MILADMDCNGFVTPSARRRKVNVFVFYAGLTFFFGISLRVMLVVYYIELYINYKGSYFQENTGHLQAGFACVENILDYVFAKDGNNSKHTPYLLTGV